MDNGRLGIEVAPVRPRQIAFYLPQFHIIPENNQWWGEGFTEWTNVKKAKPLFRGHYQPHVPGELGYYDLRDPDVRQKQADLAREYGIYGFCYYHYWFNGKRLLQLPVDEILKSRKPDFPFCLCWANENWTRRWDGMDHEILIKQNYSESDDRNHIKWLISAFRDERYIKIDGKPLFLVYRALKMPNPLITTSIWREEARKAGIGEIYLCRVESFSVERGDPTKLGFDAAVEFQPDWNNLGRPREANLFLRLVRRFGLFAEAYSQNLTYDYGTIIKRMLKKQLPNYRYFRCIAPSWDNTPRRKNGAVIINGSTPKLYESWLANTIKNLSTADPAENLIFINAWNEWGEGAHLEPDLRHGRKYLEATKRALSNCNAP